MTAISAQQDIESYRSQVRQWFKDQLPADWVARQTGCSDAEFAAFQRMWFQKLRAAGLAVPHWPKAWGGEDLPLAYQAVIYEEMARANGPRPVLYFIAMYHLASTLLSWGTQEQRERYLPAALNGEVWCQGFSEPNSGSDLASLRTRAERRGDKYIVNGQKVWSSLAHHADFCLLLARTDPNAAKHKGISYFLMDMKSPGVTVRQIRQASGQAEFCEIFLDNVEIPAENIIGEENAGWMVAQSTLSSERGLPIVELTERMRGYFSNLVELARTAGMQSDLQVRRELAQIHADIETCSLLVKSMLEKIIAGEHASEDPLYIKIHYSQLLHRFTDLGVRLSGLESQCDRPYLNGGGHETGFWMFDFINSYHWTIAGGTNEIIRNIIAERVLGLPR